MVKTKGNIVFDVLFDVSVNMCSSRCWWAFWDIFGIFWNILSYQIHGDIRQESYDRVFLPD
jgi:hypothetical protein